MLFLWYEEKIVESGRGRKIRRKRDNGREREGWKM